MRHNGHGALTLEDARTWIEETGFVFSCRGGSFPRRLRLRLLRPWPDSAMQLPIRSILQLAEELLVRLETGRRRRAAEPAGPARRAARLCGGRLGSALRVCAARRSRLAAQPATDRFAPGFAAGRAGLQAARSRRQPPLPSLKHALGREVTEAAVLRAITELWQQLRIIPVIAAPGQPAKWQLLRHRFQKAIAEGASTSQVTAISVLASIYLQAVIAASMEEVELFLAPLTARSKVREVLRGLVATRQVHTISLGHAPHFYVAGTLPEFAVAPTVYASSSMLGFVLLHAYARSRRGATGDRGSKSLRSSAAPVPVRESASQRSRTLHGHRQCANLLLTPSPRQPGLTSAGPLRTHATASRRSPLVEAGRFAGPAQKAVLHRPGPPDRARQTAHARRAAHVGVLNRPSAPRQSSTVRMEAAMAKVAGNGAHANGNGARLNGGKVRPANGASGARTAKLPPPVGTAQWPCRQRPCEQRPRWQRPHGQWQWPQQRRKSCRQGRVQLAGRKSVAEWKQFPERRAARCARFPKRQPQAGSRSRCKGRQRKRYGFTAPAQAGDEEARMSAGREPLASHLSPSGRLLSPSTVRPGRAKAPSPVTWPATSAC